MEKEFEQRLWTLVLVIVVTISILSPFGIYYVMKNPTLESAWEKGIEDEKQSYEYCQSTTRITNQTGFPKEYTCEQINVMIKASFYPRLVTNYECIYPPNEEYQHYLTSKKTIIKARFIEYYLLECLEAKEN